MILADVGRRVFSFVSLMVVSWAGRWSRKVKPRKHQILLESSELTTRTGNCSFCTAAACFVAELRQACPCVRFQEATTPAGQEDFYAALQLLAKKKGPRALPQKSTSVSPVSLHDFPPRQPQWWPGAFLGKHQVKTQARPPRPYRGEGAGVADWPLCARRAILGETSRTSVLFLQSGPSGSRPVGPWLVS